MLRGAVAPDEPLESSEPPPPLPEADGTFSQYWSTAAVPGGATHCWAAAGAAATSDRGQGEQKQPWEGASHQ